VKFTVVVPTRERCETLRATLRTCLDQSHPDLTVIVSDNASADDTRAVVASFDDPRLKYVNAGRRVSMARNWEFALDAVDDTENYVHYLGDDDGLLPDAIADVAALIGDTGARAVAWKK
jgi:glycosyltransferase involved in cell wall biosynthesis